MNCRSFCIATCTVSQCMQSVPMQSPVIANMRKLGLCTRNTPRPIHITAAMYFWQNL